MKIKNLIVAGLQVAAFGVYSQQSNIAPKQLDDVNATFWERTAAFKKYEQEQLKSEAYRERMREQEREERKNKKAGKTVEKENEGRFGGDLQFKRWEWMRSTRVDESGMIPNPEIVYTEWLKQHKQFENKNTTKRQGNNSVQTSASWQYIGPASGVPSGGGAGRLCFITFDPTNPNNMWVGSPGGGLWKSTNAGANWTVVNDLLPNLGAAHLAVDPTNTNVMYLSTGDRDGNDNYSVGLLKSTDGGATWNTTGLSYSASQMRNVNCVLIDYTNTQVLFAATGLGIYKSIDGGANWINVKGGSFKDMKFKPGDHNTIYATGATFTHSNDGGNTWINNTFPSPTGSIGRLACAVTAADPTIVYVLAGQGSAQSYGFAGFYKSTNSGASFTKTAVTANLLGWNTTGSDAGGQAWYDLIVAASPTNANEVITGGVNTWRSTNGGASFSLFTHWYGGGGKPNVHADCHAIEYMPGTSSTIFMGNDGGLFKTTNSGTSFSMSSNGLQIGEQYRLGVSQTSPNLTLTGWQDNGCSLTNQGTSSTNYVLGGDGMEVAVDPSTSTIMYGEQYNGSINQSTNSGGFFNQIVGTGGSAGTVDEDGAWVTPYVIDPNNHNTIYVGKTQVYQSTDGGGSFTSLSTGSGNEFIALAVAPSNSDFVYAAKAGEVWMTSSATSGGAFAQVTTPTGGITYLCVDPANPLRVWATASGYTAGNKVYYTSDGGMTWTNVSGNLPNMPVNCIAYGPGSNDGLYVGTEIGVYYKDNTLPNWIFYSNGLPNVIVDELEFQISTNKLRAATYGRGLWEIAAYSTPTSAPVATFSSNKTTVCSGSTVDFYDNSSNFPVSWKWTFTGATPATSNIQSPMAVTYSVAGTYPVKLVVTNAAGADSTVINTYINVLPPPTIAVTNDTTICRGDTVQICATGGTQYVWNPATGLTNPNIACPKAAPAGYKAYNVTVGDANGCSATKTVKVYVIPPPATPTVYQNNDTLCANPGSGVHYQWYYNGAIMTNDTTHCIRITQNGTYSVQVTDTSGCGFSKTSSTFSVTNIGIKTVNNESDIEIFPNPAQSIVNLKFGANLNYNVKIYSALGELVYSQSISATVKTVYPLRHNLAPGIYLITLNESGKKSIYTRRLIIVE
ncbi:MAG: T9SS type A sorting domain-containing protein [Bacteroidia bacterium]